MASEQDLIRSAVTGDKVALQSLLLMHYSDIESTIRSKIGAELSTKLEVQDLIQETLVAAYQEIGRFALLETGSFRAWIKRIAENRVIDAARNLGRIKRGGQACQVNLHKLATDSLDNLWDWVFEESNPPDRPVRHREAGEAVQVCLARLPTDQREAVIAFYFEQQETNEIAQHMGRTPGAVRELLRRARANLANDLGAASKWLSTR